MSGQLVGEVLDAAEAGHLNGLSRSAFHALFAIAEKCHTDTRQGSVRFERIRAAVREGNSVRSTRRAVSELVTAGFVQVVKRGYKLPNGATKSSIYELTTLVPSRVAQARPDACAKSADACAKYEHACAIQGGTLDGSIDGSIDGGARASAATPIPAASSPVQEPDPYCPEHMPHGTVTACGACGAAKRIRKAHIDANTAQAQQTKDARRKRITDCPLCDEKGWLLGDDGSVDDRNILCTHKGDQ